MATQRFSLHPYWIEALPDDEKVRLFTNVCGYLEDSGGCLDHFHPDQRWSRETILDYINRQFIEDFTKAAEADIETGGDKERLFQFVVLPQCRHLLPEPEDKPYLEETGQLTRHTGHLVTCLVVPHFWSLDIPEDWKKEWFLDFYRLEEEWIAGGFSAVGIDG